MGQISIIIVSWNARNYLRDCLRSIRETGGTAVHEVIVVDNDSKDGSPEMVAEEFPETILIKSGGNLGFARANNLGLKRATGSLLALVNSDVIVRSGAFQELAAVFEKHPEAGLAGPKVFSRDGSLQLTCARLPSVWNLACEFLLLNKFAKRWPIFSGFQMAAGDHDTFKQVEVLSGCFWMARRSAVDKVGGLDERYFFYAEDIDWCKRFSDAGWKLMFVPAAQITHFGGGSSSNAPLRYSIEILRANLKYWKKHHGLAGWMIFYLLVMCQHTLRLVARGFMRLTGLANTSETKHKFKEHVVCLRWLLTGKGV